MPAVSVSYSTSEASMITSSLTWSTLTPSPLLGSISSDMIPSTSPSTTGSHSGSPINGEDGTAEAEVSYVPALELSSSPLAESGISAATRTAGAARRTSTMKETFPRVERNGQEEVLRELQQLRARLEEDEYLPLLQRLMCIKEERPQRDEEGVRKLRALLKKKGLLPPELDEYHALLRYSAMSQLDHCRSGSGKRQPVDRHAG